MARHDERDTMTGRFTPKPALEEVGYLEDMYAPEDEHDLPEYQPEGVYYRDTLSRASGRVDAAAAYLPGEFRNPLAKYQHGPDDQRIAQTLGERLQPRRAIMIDAMTGEKLGDQLVQVTQPEQLFGHVPGIREVPDLTLRGE